ncbi:MAG: hypothetical protein RL093_46 [Pseudomonadota bacterium]
MMRTAILMASAALLLAPTPGAAQTAESANPYPTWREYCNAAEGRRHLDLRIGGCSHLVSAQNMTGNNVVAGFTQRAFAYRVLEEFEASLSDYSAALALDPQRVGAMVGRAAARTQMSQYPEALAEIDRALRLFPGNVDALAQRCRILALQGNDLVRAEADCTAALAPGPSWFAYLTRAMVRLRQGRLDAAEADLRAAETANADEMKVLALYGRGVIKQRRGQTAGEADMAAAMRENSGVADFFARHGLPGALKVETRNHVVLRETREAAALQTYAEWITACNGRGEGVTHGQVIAGCTMLLRSGSLPLDEIPVVLGLRASRLRTIGFYPEALTDLKHADEVRPDNAYTLRVRAAVRMDIGDVDEGLADANRAIALEAGVAFAHAVRARLYTAKGEFTRAITDWDETIRLAPEPSGNYWRRGMVWQELESWSRAIADFDRALELTPNSAEYLNSRCFVRAIQGRDLDQALADCEAALRINDQPYILDSRAAVKLAAGDFEGAYTDFDVAYGRDPNLAASLYGRGLAQIRLGRADAGRRDIAEALVKDADVAETYERMGQRP